jgi:hypothetical protein
MAVPFSKGEVNAYKKLLQAAFVDMSLEQNFL